MKTIKNNLNAAMVKAYIRAQLRTARLKDTLKDESGQFVMDHAVVFVIILVLGAAALLLLKNFLNDDLAPTLKTKIMAYFN
ncbi:hypothetical protein [Oscillibacter sp.]|uniref:hypothetical protein n=1 Tax=Oscillibacter sp. TaxID=1945593 RepID=UPI0033991101